MRIGGRRVLLCSCGGTMPLDAAALAVAADRAGLADAATPPVLHRALCQAEFGAAEAAARGSDPLLIACTQEIARFARLRPEGAAGGSPQFVNIRETAGWTEAAPASLPKIFALLAAACVPEAAPALVEVASAGRLLIIGSGQDAVEAARAIADRLETTLVLDPAANVVLPAERPFTLAVGRVRAAAGHLGAFAVTVDDHAAPLPWSRDARTTEPPADGVVRRADLLLDLDGGPARFPDAKRRLGYARADPARPGEIERALLALTELVGTIARPRFVAYDPEICAHRSGLRGSGCTRCLDACPTGAVASQGSGVAVDAMVCAGCGSCVALCPTGALDYAAPAGETTRRRVAMLLGAYREAGGERPVLLLHETGAPEDSLAAAAAHGPGLPANVLPLPLHHVTQAGLELLAGALAFGAVRVVVWIDPVHADEAAATASGIAQLEAILSGLGLGAGRVVLLGSLDPDALLAAVADDPGLADLPPLSDPPADPLRPLRLRAALDHLAAGAAAAPDPLPLPAGVPLGTLSVAEACTVCLACTRVCPIGALDGDAQEPALEFDEARCVQCGLCAATCPERAITLVPRYSATALADGPRVVAQDEVLACPRCGRSVGGRRAVEGVIARLEASGLGDAGTEAISRLRYCDSCRMVAAGG